MPLAGGPLAALLARVPGGRGAAQRFAVNDAVPISRQRIGDPGENVMTLAFVGSAFARVAVAVVAQVRHAARDGPGQVAWQVPGVAV